MAKSLLAGTLTNAVWTLLSRVLGLLRDTATAALFGLGPVMDAFNIGFRVPNLFRRLFGEGALSAAMIPVLSRYLHEKDRASAWRLASTILTASAVLLTGLALAAELVVAFLWQRRGRDPRDALTLGLVATMLPYALFICLVAQASAILQTLKHFTFPALAPVVLNICWLLAVWLLAPALAHEPSTQIYVLALAIVASGLAQLGMQAAALRRLQFVYRPCLDLADPGFRQIVRTMAPMMLGLAITQINTLVDSLIAYFFSSPGGAADTLNLFGWPVPYPMTTGAAGSLYYGDRLYQFPLAVFGLALATAIYPFLTEHAARGRLDLLAAELSRGLRLVFFIGLPASVGLVVLAHPIVLLVLCHGSFTADSALRTSRVVAMYGVGVWAYCAEHVLVRGFYASGDHTTPVKVGAAAVGFNLVMNLTLIWFLAESGLALATALSAGLRCGVLMLILRRRLGGLPAGSVMASFGRHLAASALMAVSILLFFQLVPAPQAGSSLGYRLLAVIVPIALGACVHIAVGLALGAAELRELLDPLRRRWRAPSEGR